jgi:hypothetical protein
MAACVRRPEMELTYVKYADLFLDFFGFIPLCAGNKSQAIASLSNSLISIFIGFFFPMAFSNYYLNYFSKTRKYLHWP